MNASRWLGGVAATLAFLCCTQANAYERQWHFGGQAGYALAGFSGGPFSGFGGGAHLTYGVTDVLNLRAHGDISGFPLSFDLPSGQTLDSSAVLYNGGLGVEFAFDVIQVVPYIGLTAGAAGVSVKDGDDYAMLSLETPGGLIYYPSRDFGVGVELRYRLLLFGPDEGPMHNMTAFARLEYVWGY